MDPGCRVNMEGSESPSVPHGPVSMFCVPGEKDTMPHFSAHFEEQLKLYKTQVSRHGPAPTDRPVLGPHPAGGSALRSS